MLGVWRLCYEECWVKLNVRLIVCCSCQCLGLLAQHHINSESMVVGCSRNRILKWEWSGERERESLASEEMGGGVFSDF